MARDVVIEAEPLHGGINCPFAQQRVCNTDRCATPAPSTSPTPAPTPVPTYQPSKPIINVRGDDIITVEASRSGQYKDLGATCFDDVWGNLDKFVVSSGEVDLFTPGVYRIAYSCKNPAGYVSDPTIRQVHVKDDTCPTCTMASGKDGAVDVVVEASFPYVDAGAACSDNLDGAVAVRVRNSVDVEKTGVYTVTYSAVDRHGNVNDGTCKGSRKYVRKVTVEDNLKPIIALKYGGKLIHHGHVGANNPARNWSYLNAVLMAETSTSSAWLVGSAVVAVAGLALVAVAGRRSQRVVDVAV